MAVDPDNRSGDLSVQLAAGAVATAVVPAEAERLVERAFPAVFHGQRMIDDSLSRVMSDSTHLSGAEAMPHVTKKVLRKRVMARRVGSGVAG
jgi:hypothetical protein